MSQALVDRRAELAARWPLRVLGTRPDSDGSLSALDAARNRGGAWLRQEVGRAGLRGRGGACFPVAQKWEGVVSRPGPRFVLANGEEGEPAAWKDRYLLRHRPDQVVEAVAVAALAVDAQEAWVYTADADGARAIQTAVDARRGQLAGLTVNVSLVPPSYVAGEESAAVNFINGGPALPTSKPPRPFEAGIRGQPTLVSNVESLVQAAWIARHGADEFRSTGPVGAPGTMLACISGAVESPLLWEIPVGTSIREIIAAAGPVGEPWGVLLGGYFSGFLPATLLDTPADPDILRAKGFGLGNATFVVVGEEECPIGVVADLLAFFAAETAGQCGPCVRGTAAMRDLAQGLMHGEATPADLERLQGFGVSLRGRGVCQLLDAAALTATRVFDFFGDAVADHAGGQCPRCHGRVPDPTGGYAVDVDAALAVAARDLDDT